MTIKSLCKGRNLRRLPKKFHHLFKCTESRLSNSSRNFFPVRGRRGHLLRGKHSKVKTRGKVYFRNSLQTWMMTKSDARLGSFFSYSRDDQKLPHHSDKTKIIDNRARRTVPRMLPTMVTFREGRVMLASFKLASLEPFLTLTSHAKTSRSEA